jgi:hypothetical protein
MNKKTLITLAVGILVGYVGQKYIAQIPVVNKLPVLG